MSLARGDGTAVRGDAGAPAAQAREAPGDGRRGAPRPSGVATGSATLRFCQAEKRKTLSAPNTTYMVAATMSAPTNRGTSNGGKRPPRNWPCWRKYVSLPQLSSAFANVSHSCGTTP
ncbi:MAG: hypothetical protein KatS3mg010_1939 [Acidimicrobiia bacterium]|nr:MAG: hypothetical protein KatS3mg010_1939 [Acidimicrobiia bacterium]